jgi:hypothetical protein
VSVTMPAVADAGTVVGADARRRAGRKQGARARGGAGGGASGGAGVSDAKASVRVRVGKSWETTLPLVLYDRLVVRYGRVAKAGATFRGFRSALAAVLARYEVPAHTRIGFAYFSFRFRLMGQMAHLKLLPKQSVGELSRLCS